MRKHLNPRALTAIALAAMASCGTPYVRACDQICVTQDRYEAMLARYRYVMVARVVARHEGRHVDEYDLEAIRSWNGGKRITLRNVGGGCGLGLREDRVYLVFASGNPQDIEMCSPVLGVWKESARAAIRRRS